MSDMQNNVESFEEGGSITGRKILDINFKGKKNKVDDGILSPYREEVMGSDN